MRNSCTGKRVAVVIAGAFLVSVAAGPAPATVSYWVEHAARTITPEAHMPDAPATELDLAAPLNGAASGQIVVSASQPLTAVSAVCSDLAGSSRPIAASSVRIRYLTYQPLVSTNLLVLPARARPDVTRRFYAIHDAFLPGGDSVQPVFVTVDVPPDAVPGVYCGEVRVTTSEGEAAVPVRLHVADFALPEPSDLDIWLSLSHSPTLLAYFYQVPHYSEAHWALIEEQVRLVGALGNHVLYLPVLWHANNGSGPRMIAFRDVGGALTPDFSRLDRYLALVRRHLGPQRRVVLGVWGAWVREGTTPGRFPTDEVYVTGLGPDGALSMRRLSADYAANADLWRAVFDGVAERVKAQLGVPASKIVLGMADDRHPSDAVDAAWRAIAPESPGWEAWTHNYGNPGPRPVLFEIVDTTSGKGVGGEGLSILRGGWDALDGKTLFLSTARDIQRDGVSPALYFSVPDVAVGRQKCGTTVGLARIGLDYWPRRLPGEGGGAPVVDTGFDGGPRTAPGRVDRSRTTTLTVPGPRGPVPMIHFEALREGIQCAQARIVVEKAVLAKAGDTAALLDALARHRKDGVRLDEFYRYNGNAESYEQLGGWREGAAAIYEAAGQAQRAMR